MLAIHAVPVLLGVLVAILLGLLVWGLVRTIHRAGGARRAESRETMLLGLLVLAVFSLGAFLTFMLFGALL